MKNNVKRGIVGLLLVCFVLTDSCSVFARETIHSIAPDENQEDYDRIASEEAVNYIMLTQGCVEDEVYVSNGFEVLGESDLKIYFVFVDNECLGELCVFDVNGELMSSYVELESSSISVLYENDIPFCLVNFEDTLYAYSVSLGECFVVVGQGDDNQEKVLEKTYSTVSALEESQIELELLEISTKQKAEISATSANYYTLSVPIVQNSKVSGEGICWCASIASIGAYRTGTTAMTAKSLYNILDGKYDGTPIGDEEWEGYAFDYFDISYTHISTGLEYSYVVKALKWDRPIMASITSSNEECCHAIVICGYSTTTTDGYYYYQIMDPNVTNSYVTVKINSSSSTFGYTYGSCVYTKWRWTFY